MIDDSGESNEINTDDYVEDSEDDNEDIWAEAQTTSESDKTSGTGKTIEGGKAPSPEKTENSEKAEVDYSRPAWRSGKRDEVWENAKDEHGRVRDPQTGRYMSKDKPWDMGHEPGYEFRKYQAYAKEKGMSRKEFIDGYNNIEHIRPELPSSNRSHKCEDMTDKYFGEDDDE